MNQEFLSAFLTVVFAPILGAFVGKLLWWAYCAYIQHLKK